VWMVNVHASGGTAMMQSAGDAAREAAARAGTTPPLVIAVTVLTSMTAETLAEIGGQSEDSPGSGIRGAGSGVRGAGSVIDRVVRLARLAEGAGLDGVVASPLETATIREHCGRHFAIITPGIRGGGAGTTEKDDQARTMSAGEAIAAGASYIVVGRPIIAAADPRAAAEAIVEEARRGAPTSR
jgi:orotidine-5'-phosphate decarboxylase